MPCNDSHEPRSAATEAKLVAESEIGVLSEVFRMLPAGVTVQDEHGDFLLMNDAAAVQFGGAAAERMAFYSRELDHPRETSAELLRSGRAAVAEECVTTGEVWQFLRLEESAVTIDRVRLFIDNVGGILAALQAIIARGAGPAS